MFEMCIVAYTSNRLYNSTVWLLKINQCLHKHDGFYCAIVLLLIDCSTPVLDMPYLFYAVSTTITHLHISPLLVPEVIGTVAVDAVLSFCNGLVTCALYYGFKGIL